MLYQRHRYVQATLYKYSYVILYVAVIAIVIIQLASYILLIHAAADLEPTTPDPCHCLVDPCQGATCPDFPHARCVADYCGGCTARFFLPTGEEVTKKCGE